MRDRIYDTLERYWGYSGFRPQQEEIIQSVLDGNDTLGLLPTGGGKSVTFQIPAIILDGLTIVVTPLISLMKDQVDNLRDRNIKAVYIHSGLSRAEHRLAMDRCRLGKVTMLYLSPEKLQSPTFVEQLRDMPVRFIVVDEAHCISQWGYDFRPSYLRIASLRDMFPQAPVLALTASATPEVADDIMRLLRFRSRNIFSRSFARQNISYIVRLGENKPEQLIHIMRNTAGTAIVYARSRRRTREIADQLTASGISADYYHAGLSIEEKTDKQNRWKQGQCRVMVATNAFGMGIDKPDVRTVVHMDLPSSLEEYYQEAGRAGRDGKPSFAVILASKRDKAMLTRRISDNFPDKDFIRRVYELAGNFVNVAVGSGFNQVYDFNFPLFCQRFDLPPVPARSALRLLSQAGYIDFIEEVETRARVMMLVDKSALYNTIDNPTADRVLQHILRRYTGLFADYVFISESAIAYQLGLTDEQVYQALLSMNREHILHYVPRRTNPYIYYTTSRELPKYIQLPPSVYEDMRARMVTRIEAIKRFVYDDTECRANTLLRYFGEDPDCDCRTCDVCRSRRRHKADAAELDILRQSILYMASRPQGTTVAAIIADAPAKPKITIAMIRSLIDSGHLKLDGDTVTAPQ